MAAIYFGLLALGLVLAASVAAIGAGVGEGIVCAAYIQGIARQPEAQSRLMMWMFICFGMIEFTFIFGMFVFFSMKGMLPAGTPEQIAQLLSSMK